MDFDFYKYYRSFDFTAINKENFESFQNGVEVKDWNFTLFRYEFGIRDFDVRKSRVPDIDISFFIDREIEKIITNNTKDGDRLNGYQYGFNEFNNGSYLSKGIIEMELMINGNIKTDTENEHLSVFLWDMVCGYVDAMLFHYLNGLKNNREEDEDEENSNNLPSKLIWKGTPSQFGFLIIELIGKGYLEKPTRSFEKDANLYLDIFDIKGAGGNTTVGTLGKEINEKSNSLSTDNGRLLNLPRIEQLK